MYIELDLLINHERIGFDTDNKGFYLEGNLIAGIDENDNITNYELNKKQFKKLLTEFKKLIEGIKNGKIKIITSTAIC